MKSVAQVAQLRAAFECITWSMVKISSKYGEMSLTVSMVK